MAEYMQYIRNVEPYVPGEQPDFPDMVKLNTNENPYPPSPKVAEAIAAIPAADQRLYPDPTTHKLNAAIAKRYRLEESQVFTGVGSDDVLSMLFLTFFNSGKPILFPDITYAFYPVWANLYRIPYRTLPLDEQFRIVAEDYYVENGGIVFPNPNAPTGIAMPLQQVRSILEHNPNSIVIVDEAYVDFGGESAVALLPEFPNLIVVQTFSKSRALAGSRVAFCLGAPELIRALHDVKYSFNSYTLNRAAIAAGTAAMEDEAYFRSILEKIIDTREKTKQQLAQLGFQFPDSKSNFLFVTHPDYDANELFAALRKAQIFVRHFSAPRVDQYLRITIGTPEEMEKLVRFLQNYIEKNNES